MDWRESFAAGIGRGPSDEIVAAREGVDKATQRRIRRSVRKGQAESDVAGARYAVAIAREQQRQSPGVFVVMFFAVMVGLCAWLAARRLLEGSLDFSGVFFTVATVGGLYILGMLWRIQRHATQAELENLSVLERAGAPYSVDGVRRPVEVSPAARALAAIVLFLLYDVTYGAITVLRHGRAFTVGTVIGEGAIWAVFMAIFNLAVFPALIRKRRERPSAGQRR